MVTIRGINNLLFIILGLGLCLLAYFLIVYLAADVYGESESTQSSIASVLVRIFIELLCLFFLLINFRGKSSSKVIRVTPIVACVLLWLSWMLICSITTGGRYPFTLTAVLFWPLIFLAFYVYIAKYPDNFNNIIKLFLTLFIVCLGGFLYVLLAKNITVVDRLASVNHVYFLILLLPWVLSVKKQYIKLLGLFIIIATTLLSAKRGAILIVGISTLLYVYYNYLKGNRNLKNRAIQFLLAATFVLGLIFAFIYINDQSSGYITERFTNVNEDQGSGRLMIYSNVWELQKGAKFEKWIFGHGHNSVIHSTRYGLSAHNDFLEILFDYGVFALMIFLLLIAGVIWRSYLLYRKKSFYWSGYIASLIILLVMASISHLILYPTYFVFLSAYWGAIEALAVVKKLT